MELLLTRGWNQKSFFAKNKKAAFFWLNKHATHVKYPNNARHMTQNKITTQSESLQIIPLLENRHIVAVIESERELQSV